MGNGRPGKKGEERWMFTISGIFSRWGRMDRQATFKGKEEARRYFQAPVNQPTTDGRDFPSLFLLAVSILEANNEIPCFSCLPVPAVSSSVMAAAIILAK